MTGCRQRMPARASHLGRDRRPGPYWSTPDASRCRGTAAKPAPQRGAEPEAVEVRVQAGELGPVDCDRGHRRRPAALPDDHRVTVEWHRKQAVPGLDLVYFGGCAEPRLEDTPAAQWDPAIWIPFHDEAGRVLAEVAALAGCGPAVRERIVVQRSVSAAERDPLTAELCRVSVWTPGCPASGPAGRRRRNSTAATSASVSRPSGLGQASWKPLAEDLRSAACGSR
jgi:hypothetical protein